MADKPVALHFLDHEVESAPEFHYEFIEQACKSPASFFVVTGPEDESRRERRSLQCNRR
jgi:hypothetical protein